MALNPLAKAHKTRLKVLNRVKQRFVGQSTSITLLSKNKTSGGFDELLTLDKNWSKDRIRSEFLSRENAPSHEEEFQIPADALDAETAKRVTAVLHESTTYSVKTPLAPQEFTQYWRILIISAVKQ